MDRGLRLVKAQVAAKQHECAECPELIEVGERYMRAAIPGDGSLFPSPDQVAQEDAWRYVDGEWLIEKTHELCYTARYYKPVLQSGRVSCGHRSYADTSNCAEIACGNYAGKHWATR